MTATTLLDVLDTLEHDHERGYTFLSHALEPDFWSFQRLIAEARQRAAYFRAAGLAPGARMALSSADAREFVLSFLGAVVGGIVPVPLLPLRRGRAGHHLQLASDILRSSAAEWLVSDSAHEELCAAAANVGVQRVIAVDQLAHEAADCSEHYERVLVGPDDACFLQFTSGSTRSPKGVVVTHRNLIANSKLIMVDGLNCDARRECTVCWLPLHHDMGLIGHVIAPLTLGVQIVFLPTLAFLARPSVWLETVHRFRGTVTFGPNFAFAMAARQPPREALDLSCLRVVGCGAEPIQAATLRAFLDTYAPSGLRPEAIMPCYGLAEATLAVSFDALDRPMRTLRVERSAYEQGKVVPSAVPNGDSIELVSCGVPFPEHELSILDPQHEPLPEGRVGEIAIKGPCVTDGYFRDPESTRAQRAGAFLLTGDLGVLLDGELFVCGRKKDLIIVDGRNFDPHAVEWAVEELPGVRRGGVVAFSITGEHTESVVVVAEAARKVDQAELARTIRQHLRVALDLRVEQALIVAPGSLPKTSSGKLQRQRAKQLYASGSFTMENCA